MDKWEILPYLITIAIVVGLIVLAYFIILWLFLLLVEIGREYGLIGLLAVLIIVICCCIGYNRRD